MGIPNRRFYRLIPDDLGLDGTIYIGSGDDSLYAVNPDGTLKWNLTTALRLKVAATCHWRRWYRLHRFL